MTYSARLPLLQSAHRLMEPDARTEQRETMPQQQGAVLSHVTSLAKQWKRSAEILHRQHHAASHHAGVLAEQLQRSTASIAQMEHALNGARQRLLNGSSLRNACHATAQQVCRMYTGVRRTLLGKLIIRGTGWDRVEALVKQATELSKEGKNHQACGPYLEAACCGLMLLKKLHRNLLLRPVLRGYALNALEQQFDAQWQLFVEAGETFQDTPAFIPPECSAEFLLDVAYYSRQANRHFADVGAAFQHFSDEGWKRGLDPHPLFVTREFLERNRDAINPAANPLVEYHRLLVEAREPEAHPRFSGSWLRSYFWESSPADLREGLAEIPTTPTEAERAATFSKLPPKVAIGIILFHASDDEVSKMIRVLEKAAESVVAAGFERPQFVLTDNSQEWNADTIKAHSSAIKTPIHFLATSGNAGFGCGHNYLMNYAFGNLGATYYLCLNPDGYLHPDAVVEMIRAALRQGRPALVEALQAPCEHPKEYDPGTLETNWSTAGCLLIPRFLFELTGGFDERFFLYCEDVDLSWRVWSHGYPCVVAPRALFHHRLMSRMHDSTVDRWYLESGRLLAAKWGNTRFRLLCEQWLVEREYYASDADLPSVGEPSPLHPHVRVDFGNLFTFSRFRW